MQPTFRLRKRVGLEFLEPSLTVQDSRDECDVNYIMAKYERTGLIKHREQDLQYGDFSKIADYHVAMNVVAHANTMFFDLPSRIRERFGNDPGEFLKFASDEKNVDEMIELGLKKPLPVPEDPVIPPVTPVVDPPK